MDPFDPPFKTFANNLDESELQSIILQNIINEEIISFLMLNSNTILSQLDQRSDTIKRMDVKRIGLFGSYIRGDQGHDSDIDILIEFWQGEEKFRNLLELHELLSGLFHKRIEIVTMRGLRPYAHPPGGALH